MIGLSLEVGLCHSNSRIPSVNVLPSFLAPTFSSSFFPCISYFLLLFPKVWQTLEICKQGKPHVPAINMVFILFPFIFLQCCGWNPGP